MPVSKVQQAVATAPTAQAEARSKVAPWLQASQRLPPWQAGRAILQAALHPGDHQQAGQLVVEQPAAGTAAAAAPDQLDMPCALRAEAEEEARQQPALKQHQQQQEAAAEQAQEQLPPPQPRPQQPQPQPHGQHQEGQQPQAQPQEQQQQGLQQQEQQEALQQQEQQEARPETPDLTGPDLLSREAPACRVVLGSMFVDRGQLERGLAAVERLLLGALRGLVSKIVDVAGSNGNLFGRALACGPTCNRPCPSPPCRVPSRSGMCTAGLARAHLHPLVSLLPSCLNGCVIMPAACPRNCLRALLNRSHMALPEPEQGGGVLLSS